MGMNTSELIGSWYDNSFGENSSISGSYGGGTMTFNYRKYI